MEEKAYLWENRGTNEEPYVIETNEELEEFADYVNMGGDCEGLSFRLGADLDWNNQKWTVIGSYHNQFAGTFNGDDHAVSGMSLPSGKEECGFFGCLAAGAVVKKLTVKAEAAVSMSQNSSIGFLAGINYGTIENCHAGGNLTITQDSGDGLFAGLLVGRNQGGSQLSNCSADGCVTGKEGDGEDIICGLAGQNEAGAVITECVLKGSVTGCGSMAGICKKNSGEVSKCQNLAHMKMDICKPSATLHVFSPDYTTGDAVSGGIYEVSVGEKVKTAVALGQQDETEGENSTDIIITSETPLHIVKDETASYRRVTLLNGGYITIEGSASLDIDELYRETSEQGDGRDPEMQSVQAEEQESEAVIPHYDPEVGLRHWRRTAISKKDIIVSSQTASAEVKITIQRLYSDLELYDENQCYICCKTDAGSDKDDKDIVKIEVTQK